MKYLKPYKLFEKVKSYTWNYNGITKKDGNYIEYTFSDDYNNDYTVEFTKKSPESDISEVKYYVKDNGINSMNKIVNANPFRTMKTLLSEIVPDYLDRFKNIKKLLIVGLGKDLERDLITQRTKLYLRHLTNNPIPGFTLRNHENRIELIRNDI